MTTKTTRLAAMGLAAMLAAAPAIAQVSTGQATGQAPAAQAPAAQAPAADTGAQPRQGERRGRDHGALSARIDAAAALRAVEAAGYRGVTELEWDNGAWEVKAHTAEGARVKLAVDPTTGAVRQLRRR